MINLPMLVAVPIKFLTSLILGIVAIFIGLLMFALFMSFANCPLITGGLPVYNVPGFCGSSLIGGIGIFTPIIFFVGAFILSYKYLGKVIKFNV